MNEANIKYAIEVMKGAENLNMCNFQDGDGDCSTIEELHTCGNTACFVGYLCLTDAWRDFFLAIDPSAECNRMGDVSFERGGVLLDSYALAEFLGISEQVAYRLIFGCDVGQFQYGFYSVPFKDVEPEHVIEKLEQILSGELI